MSIYTADADDENEYISDDHRSSLFQFVDDVDHDAGVRPLLNRSEDTTSAPDFTRPDARDQRRTHQTRKGKGRGEEGSTPSSTAERIYSKISRESIAPQREVGRPSLRGGSGDWKQEDETFIGFGNRIISAEQEVITEDGEEEEEAGEEEGQDFGKPSALRLKGSHTSFASDTHSHHSSFRRFTDLRESSHQTIERERQRRRDRRNSLGLTKEEKSNSRPRSDTTSVHSFGSSERAPRARSERRTSFQGAQEQVGRASSIGTGGSTLLLDPSEEPRPRPRLPSRPHPTQPASIRSRKERDPLVRQRAPLPKFDSAEAVDDDPRASRPLPKPIPRSERAGGSLRSRPSLRSISTPTSRNGSTLSSERSLGGSVPYEDDREEEDDEVEGYNPYADRRKPRVFSTISSQVHQSAVAGLASREELEEEDDELGEDVDIDTSIPGSVDRRSRQQEKRRPRVRVSSVNYESIGRGTTGSEADPPTVFSSGESRSRMSAETGNTSPDALGELPEVSNPSSSHDPISITNIATTVPFEPLEQVSSLSDSPINDLNSSSSSRDDHDSSRASAYRDQVSDRPLRIPPPRSHSRPQSAQSPRGPYSEGPERLGVSSGAARVLRTLSPPPVPSYASHSSGLTSRIPRPPRAVSSGTPISTLPNSFSVSPSVRETFGESGSQAEDDQVDPYGLSSSSLPRSGSQIGSPRNGEKRRPSTSSGFSHAPNSNASGSQNTLGPPFKFGRTFTTEDIAERRGSPVGQASAAGLYGGEEGEREVTPAEFFYYDKLNEARSRSGTTSEAGRRKLVPRDERERGLDRVDLLRDYEARDRRESSASDRTGASGGEPSTSGPGRYGTEKEQEVIAGANTGSMPSPTKLPSMGRRRDSYRGATAPSSPLSAAPSSPSSPSALQARENQGGDSAGYSYANISPSRSIRYGGKSSSGFSSSEGAFETADDSPDSTLSFDRHPKTASGSIHGRPRTKSAYSSSSNAYNAFDLFSGLAPVPGTRTSSRPRHLGADGTEDDRNPMSASQRSLPLRDEISSSDYNQDVLLYMPSSSSRSSAAALLSASKSMGGVLSKAPLAPLIKDVPGIARRRLAKRDSSQLLFAAEAASFSGGKSDKVSAAGSSSVSISGSSSNGSKEGDQGKKGVGLREKASRSYLPSGSNSNSTNSSSWYRVKSSIRQSGVLTLYDKDQTVLQSVDLTRVPRSDVRLVDNSLFGRPNCIGIHWRSSPHPLPLSPSLGSQLSLSNHQPKSSHSFLPFSLSQSGTRTPDPIQPDDSVYLCLDSTPAMQAFYVMLKAYAQPEIYNMPVNVEIQQDYDQDQGVENGRNDASDSVFRMWRSLKVTINDVRTTGEGVARPYTFSGGERSASRGNLAWTNPNHRTSSEDSFGQSSLPNESSLDSQNAAAAGASPIVGSPLSHSARSRDSADKHDRDTAEADAGHPLTSSMSGGPGGSSGSNTFYFCEVIMEGRVVARTAAKKGSSSPVWNETFEFSDLGPILHPLAIQIYQYGRSSKPALFGTATIPNPRQDGTATYPVLNMTKDPRGVETPEVVAELNLGLTFEEDVIMLAEQYGQLLQAIDDQFDTRAVYSLVSDVCLGSDSYDLEDVADILLRIYLARGTLPTRLQQMARNEIRDVGDTDRSSTTLFRGNTLLTKMLELYLRMIGSDYLEVSIGEVVRKICADKVEIEIDPSKAKGKDKELAENIKLLEQWSTKVWESIYVTRHHCPHNLRNIFNNILQEVDTHLEEKHFQFATRFTSISAFIFLRFFTPAILNPKLFGLVPTQPEAKVQRTLTLIAKTLQGLANMLPTFGGKEPWMAAMNPFLQEHTSAFVDFMTHVCSPAATNKITWTSPLYEGYRHPNSLLGSLTRLHAEGLPTLPHLLDLSRDLALSSKWITAARKQSRLYRETEGLGRPSIKRAPSEQRDRISEACRVIEKKAKARYEALCTVLSSSQKEEYSREEYQAPANSVKAPNTPPRVSSMAASRVSPESDQSSTAKKRRGHRSYTVSHTGPLRRNSVLRRSISSERVAEFLSPAQILAADRDLPALSPQLPHPSHSDSDLVDYFVAPTPTISRSGTQLGITKTVDIVSRTVETLPVQAQAITQQGAGTNGNGIQIVKTVRVQVEQANPSSTDALEGSRSSTPSIISDVSDNMAAGRLSLSEDPSYSSLSSLGIIDSRSAYSAAPIFGMVGARAGRRPSSPAILTGPSSTTASQNAEQYSPSEMTPRQETPQAEESAWYTTYDHIDRIPDSRGKMGLIGRVLRKNSRAS